MLGNSKGIWTANKSRLSSLQWRSLKAFVVQAGVINGQFIKPKFSQSSPVSWFVSCSINQSSWLVSPVGWSVSWSVQSSLVQSVGQSSPVGWSVSWSVQSSVVQSVGQSSPGQSSRLVSQLVSSVKCSPVSWSVQSRPVQSAGQSVGQFSPVQLVGQSSPVDLVSQLVGPVHGSPVGWSVSWSVQCSRFGQLVGQSSPVSWLVSLVQSVSLVGWSIQSSPVSLTN